MGWLKMIAKVAFQPSINNAKGKIGESKVSAKMTPLMEKDEQKQINNLMLVDENGKSYQIDHVVIRHNGIFCIETKNYSGWIFGNELQPMWTQTLYTETHKLPNPIRQNCAHIYQLSKVLGDKYKINSIIVMAQNNADKIDVPYVINLKDLKAYLSGFNDGTQYLSSELQSIYQTLLASSRSDMTKQQHIANIQETKKSVQKELCPRCGSRLCLRNGKYGQFYGCTNFPNCKFTKNI